MPTAVTFTLFFLTAATPIPWRADLRPAFERAAQSRSVVVVAVHLPGDWTSAELFARHYRDKALVALAERSVNVLCLTGVERLSAGEKRLVPGATAETYQDGEAVLRTKLSHTGLGRLRAPQHVFFHPDGKVISSITGRVTVGELEWVWAHAVAKVSGTEWQPGARNRAPQGLVLGAAPQGDNDQPSADEVAAAVKALKRSAGFDSETRSNQRKAYRSESDRARRLTEQRLERGPGFAARAALREIAKSSPPSWWNVAAGFLSSRSSKRTRASAAQALEALASPRAVSAVRAQLRREEDPSARGYLLRAMVASAPTDRTGGRLVELALRKAGDPRERLGAALATGWFEEATSYSRAIAAALDDDTPVVRSAAAWVVAWRRDRGSAQRLAAALEFERNPGVRKLLEAATEAIRGGDLSAFDGYPRKLIEVLDPDATREPPRGRGRRGSAPKGSANGGKKAPEGEGEKGKTKRLEQAVSPE